MLKLTSDIIWFTDILCWEILITNLNSLLIIGLVSLHRVCVLQNCAIFACDLLKVYSLSAFQIYSIAFLTVITMLFINSPGLIYLITSSFHILPPSPFSLMAFYKLLIIYFKV